MTFFFHQNIPPVLKNFLHWYYFKMPFGLLQYFIANDVVNQTKNE
jgi:hypothetical protein